MQPDHARPIRPGGQTGREAGAAEGTTSPDGADSLARRDRALEDDGDSPVRRGRNLTDDEDPVAHHDRDLGDVWEVLLSIRETVENDHAHRLQRIETDLRWVMALLAGLVIALVGAAFGGVFRG